MSHISIETANVPVQLKEAMIRPKLKKESLDHEVYSKIREGNLAPTHQLLKG